MGKRMHRAALSLVLVFALVATLGIPPGGSSAAAAASPGDPFAWGLNNFGQLGDGSSTNGIVPVHVPRLPDAVAIAGGLDHSLALTSDGRLFAWGSNRSGQLGDGTFINRSVPVEVLQTGTPLIGRQVVAVAAGVSHSLALTSDGKVFAWGLNSFGQLGDGSTFDSSVPVAVDQSNLTGREVVAVSAGGNHNLALASDGTVFAWGLNSSGQLGDGTTINRSVPVSVDTTATPLFNKIVVAVAAGFGHSLALSEGKVFAWGRNSEGELGDGTLTQRIAPVAVIDTGVLLNKIVVAVAGGFYHSLALDSDSNVFGWGFNGSGQLGDFTTINRSVPIAVGLPGPRWSDPAAAGPYRQGSQRRRLRPGHSPMVSPLAHGPVSPRIRRPHDEHAAGTVRVRAPEAPGPPQRQSESCHEQNGGNEEVDQQKSGVKVVFQHQEDGRHGDQRQGKGADRSLELLSQCCCRSWMVQRGDPPEYTPARQEDDEDQRGHESGPGIRRLAEG